MLHTDSMSCVLVWDLLHICVFAISVQDIILAQIPVVVVPCPCHVPPGPSMSDLTNKAGSFVFLLKFGPWLRKPLLFHFGSHSKDTYTLQGHLSKKFDWSCSENSFLIAHFLLHFWGSVGPGMLGRHCWVSIHMFPRLIRPSGWIFLIYIYYSLPSHLGLYTLEIHIMMNFEVNQKMK